MGFLRIAIFATGSVQCGCQRGRTHRHLHSSLCLHLGPHTALISLFLGRVQCHREQTSFRKSQKTGPAWLEALEVEQQQQQQLVNEDNSSSSSSEKSSQECPLLPLSPSSFLLASGTPTNLLVKCTCSHSLANSCSNHSLQMLTQPSFSSGYY